MERSENPKSLHSPFSPQSRAAAALPLHALGPAAAWLSRSSAISLRLQVAALGHARELRAPLMRAGAWGRRHLMRGPGSAPTPAASAACPASGLALATRRAMGDGGPGRRAPVASACAPHAWRAWARAAPWEPPRGALQVRVQALGVATRAWAPRQARGHCSTATAAANAPPWAGAQRVGPSRLGRGAAGPRPPVLAVRRAEPLAGVVFGQASTHMMRTAW